MILCVNANAAIDKTVVVRHFHLNDIHRPERVLAIPGGKGCNVARGLKQLGESPVVTGWVGGSAGVFIEEGLHREGIPTDFVQTPFESRTCLSILDPESGAVTEIYEKGDPVPPNQFVEFKERFRTIIGHYAAVTFSGSLPPGVPLNLYGELLDIARSAGVPGLLDSGGEALRLGVAQGKPYLVKPNRRELADIIGGELTGIADIAEAARIITARSESKVVVSLGAEGVVAIDRGQALHIRPPQLAIKSAVGSGDCLLAGITYGLTHSFSFEGAVEYGVAAGTANALTVGAGNFKLDDFDRVLSKLTLTRLTC